MQEKRAPELSLKEQDAAIPPALGVGGRQELDGHHPQSIITAFPTSGPLPKPPSSSNRGRRAGSEPAPIPHPPPLPSKPLLARCAGQSLLHQALLEPGVASRLGLPPAARKPWTAHSSCSPTQSRRGQELCRAKIKKSPGLPISYIYQPATAPLGTKVFKHWKESA